MIFVCFPETERFSLLSPSPPKAGVGETQAHKQVDWTWPSGIALGVLRVRPGPKPNLSGIKEVLELLVIIKHRTGIS